MLLASAKDELLFMHQWSSYSPARLRRAFERNEGRNVQSCTGINELLRVYVKTLHLQRRLRALYLFVNDFNIVNVWVLRKLNGVVGLQPKSISKEPRPADSIKDEL